MLDKTVWRPPRVFNMNIKLILWLLDFLVIEVETLKVFFHCSINAFFQLRMFGCITEIHWRTLHVSSPPLEILCCFILLFLLNLLCMSYMLLADDTRHMNARVLKNILKSIITFTKTALTVWKTVKGIYLSTFMPKMKTKCVPCEPPLAESSYWWKWIQCCSFLIRDWSS